MTNWRKYFYYITRKCNVSNIERTLKNRSEKCQKWYRKKSNRHRHFTKKLCNGSSPYKRIIKLTYNKRNTNESHPEIFSPLSDWQKVKSWQVILLARLWENRLSYALLLGAKIVQPLWRGILQCLDCVCS